MQSGASHLAADLAAIPRLSADGFKKIVDEQSYIIIDTRNVSEISLSLSLSLSLSDKQLIYKGVPECMLRN